MQLTPSQQAAVDCDAELSVIIANPGTGKTETLARKIARVAQERGSDTITALTFTVAAADELRERVRRYIGDAADHLRVSTSHGMALEIHRKVSPDALVYDESDMKDVRAAAAFDLGLKASSDDPALEVEVERIMRRANAVSFDMMLKSGWDILEGTPLRSRPTHYSARFLFVDEAQDIAPEEAALFGVLGYSHLTLVGDPNQEIYAFRGASRSWMLETMAAATVHRLDETWRVPQAIMDHARELPLDPDPGEVVSFAQEGAWSARKDALEDIVEGLPDDEPTAVLCRTNRRAMKVARILRSAGFGVHCPSRQSSILQSEGARYLHAFLRLSFHPDDLVAFRRVVQVLEMTEKDVDLVEIERELTGNSLGSSERVDCPSATGVVGNARFELSLVDMAYERVTGWFRRHHRHTRVDEAVDAWERARRWIGTGRALSDYLDNLSMRELMERAEREPNPSEVWVGTIHGAKGREWDHVVLAGWKPGEVPNPSADRGEEARLAWVAMTRAKRSLTFSCGEGHELTTMEDFRG